MNRPTKFTFVALPVSEILGGTRTTAIFRKKIIAGICLAYHCEYAYQILYS